MQPSPIQTYAHALCVRAPRRVSCRVLSVLCVTYVRTCVLRLRLYLVQRCLVFVRPRVRASLSLVFGEEMPCVRTYVRLCGSAHGPHASSVFRSAHIGTYTSFTDVRQPKRGFNPRPVRVGWLPRWPRAPSKRRATPLQATPRRHCRCNGLSRRHRRVEGNALVQSRKHPASA